MTKLQLLYKKKKEKKIRDPIKFHFYPTINPTSSNFFFLFSSFPLYSVWFIPPAEFNTGIQNILFYFTYIYWENLHKYYLKY